MLARKLALLQTLLRLGLRRLWLVFLHRRRLRSGYYERTLPSRSWSEIGPNGGLVSPFNRPEKAPLSLEKADRIVQGTLCYFSWKWLPRPTTWRENPTSGHETPTGHWSRVSDFDARQGDIKWIWEPSRFDWAVTLARAYAFSSDPRYEAVFWDLIDDWRAHNPPNTGVNWFCGQECSLRLLAIVLASTVFGDRDGKLASTATDLAERIEPTMGYAIGQHNNHGTSEAMGLYIAGTCLPDHPRATHWRTQGRRILSTLIREQFATDGSYVQHSFVYQRLAMRACLVAFHAARRFGEPFPAEVEGRVLESARFMRSLMAVPGRLPNYGANDGANAGALSDCEYLDFRPIVQLAYAMLAGERAFEPGEWDGELAWFGIDPSKLIPASVVPSVFRAEAGGYFALRGDAGSYAFMRVPHYRDGRPGQADALHVDIWLGGSAVAVDSGTFSYNDPDGWNKYFKSTRAHNTVEVDGKDQMPLASRFLYTHWTRCEAPTSQLDSDGKVMFETGSMSTFANDHHAILGISHAYEQMGLGVRHERLLQRFGSSVMVTDTLLAQSEHRYVVRWHLVGQWHAASTGTFVRNDGVTLELVGDNFSATMSTDRQPECTHSLAYGDSEPLTLIEVELRDSTCSLTTTFSHGPV